MKGHPDALALIAGVLASILEPPVQMLPSVWAAQNLVVPDGPKAGEKWSRSLTPYIVEPLDALAPDSGVNKVVVRKSAQTGFTLLGIAFVGHSIDIDPCRMMVVQPSDSALTEFNAEKLGEAISHSPVLRKKVRSQVSRSGKGSTTYVKRFSGGSVTLAIATSSKDLRSKTIKKVFKDECSDYPADLDGQGSPHAMIEARYESFLRSGDWKELDVSTPTLKSECYVDEEFEKGDQRYWHVACPGCGAAFRFVFDRKWFRFNDAYPYEAHYVTPCCGTIIDGHQKYALVQESPYGWIATAPGPGKHRSYHFDALSSVFVPWDKIAERFLLAADDPAKQKGFFNLTLGLAFEMKGDSPDHKLLMERRMPMNRYRVPAMGLMLVAAADVQMRGIYYEVLALGPDRQSWVVDAMFLDGDTTDPVAGAFARLTEVYERQYADAYGGKRRVDAFGVDSGFRSHVVYTWCRARPGAFALDGRDGWTRPAIGTPSLVDVDFGGRKIKQGATIWPVGTWPLKATFYSNLRKPGMKGGAEYDPPGYCHFGTWLDETYFLQITAEYLADEKFRGRTRKVWKVQSSRENHFLDCRVYNMALADYLGLNRMTSDEWAELAAQRGVPPEDRKPELFRPKAAPPPDTAAPATEAQQQPKSRGWLDGYKVDL